MIETEVVAEVPPPALTRPNTRTQDDVNVFMLTLYNDEATRPATRDAAFVACRKGPDGWRGQDEDERWATDPQMRIAMRKVPTELKNKRGWSGHRSAKIRTRKRDLIG